MNILKVLTSRRKTGNFGESAAAKFLKKKGYKILERNYVAQNHEIDIIAENKDVISFTEVKTRTIGHENPREPRPASSVNPKKQRSIISAAKTYLSYHKPNKKTRLDIIEVYINSNNGKKTVAEINHLKNAFNMDTAFEKNKYFD